MLISLIVPVYNESETINSFYKEVKNDSFLSKKQIEIIFINDGSTDDTRYVVEEIINQDKSVRLFNLSRNFGKEAALFCGLEKSNGDIVIPLDVDLQDPINLISEMYKKWKSGADIVLAKRADRSLDHPLKRITANLFYKIHNALSDAKIEENVGDFRLMDKKVVDVVINLSERNIFMKGLLSWPGFNVAIVEYCRPLRFAGKSKFTPIKLINLAIEGITSFSISPLKIATYMGFSISLFSFFYGFILILEKLFFNVSVPGYTSLMTMMIFLGGVQLITIGILGEYVGRIYIETKKRPRYVIESEINKD